MTREKIEMELLTYRPGDRGFPLPENEKTLPTITAEHFLDVPMDGVTPGRNILEGLCFDRNGNLYFCCSPLGQIYFVNRKTRELSLFKEWKDTTIAAIKIHKNGDLYVAITVSPKGSVVVVVSPDGKIKETLPMPEGHRMDDLVFDDNGGFYLSDISGTLANRSAGIYYMEPDHRTIHAVVKDGMIATNGIALTRDKAHLWVTEYDTSTLHWLELSGDRMSLAPIHNYQPYHFTGVGGPDSITIDEDGNLYVSMTGQGRFLIFNENGYPIGNILIPGREEGHMLKSTHIVVDPFEPVAYMCSADLKTGRSALFRAGVYAKSFRSYQFQ